MRISSWIGLTISWGLTLSPLAPRIPDKDREFPLFPKGNERVRFDYGVFLLNKNIAQLRWLCGESTGDAKPTLRNLSGLLNLCSTSRYTEEVKKQKVQNFIPASCRQARSTGCQRRGRCWRGPCCQRPPRTPRLRSLGRWK